MLRLQRERLGRVGIEPISLPAALEEIESQLAPQGFLDDLAVAAAATSCPHLHSPQHIRVDRQRCSDLSHHRIIASRCCQAARAIGTVRVDNPEARWQIVNPAIGGWAIVVSEEIGIEDLAWEVLDEKGKLLLAGTGTRLTYDAEEP